MRGLDIFQVQEGWGFARKEWDGFPNAHYDKNTYTQ